MIIIMINTNYNSNDNNDDNSFRSPSFAQLPHLTSPALACHEDHTCRHLMSHVATSVDYWKLRHFCDDPVCPDPVWKLPL